MNKVKLLSDLLNIDLSTYSIDNINEICRYLENNYNLKENIRACILYVMITEDMHSARCKVQELNISDSDLYCELVRKVAFNNDYASQFLLERMYEYDLGVPRILYILYSVEEDILIQNPKLLTQLSLLSYRVEDYTNALRFIKHSFIYLTDEQMKEHVEFLDHINLFELFLNSPIKQEFYTFLEIQVINNNKYLLDIIKSYNDLINPTLYEIKISEHEHNPTFIIRLIHVLTHVSIRYNYYDLCVIYKKALSLNQVSEIYLKALYELYVKQKHNTFKALDIYTIEQLLKEDIHPQYRSDLYISAIFGYNHIEHMYPYVKWYCKLDEDIEVHLPTLLFCLRETYDKNDIDDLKDLEYIYNKINE